MAHFGQRHTRLPGEWIARKPPPAEGAALQPRARVSYTKLAGNLYGCLFVLELFDAGTLVDRAGYDLTIRFCTGAVKHDGGQQAHVRGLVFQATLEALLEPLRGLARTAHETFLRDAQRHEAHLRVRVVQLAFER